MTKNEKIIQMGISAKAFNSPFIDNKDLNKIFKFSEKTATSYINEFAEYVGEGKLYPECTLIYTGEEKRRYRVGLYAFVHYMTYRRWIRENKKEMFPAFNVYDIKKGIGNIDLDSNERSSEELKKAIRLEVQVQIAKLLQDEMNLAI